jgi:hypothetical protein
VARINIEDCWWTDPRRERLGTLVGSMLTADAVIIRAWRVAQEFWGNERGLVPTHVFQTLEANDKLIQANLAEVREGGVYVRGSSQYLEWVNERRAAARAGGRKSAEKRNKKVKQAPTKRKQTQASDSGSLSGSISNSDSRNIAILEKSPNPIQIYCEMYKEKYGHNPVIGGKQSGILNNFAKNHPRKYPNLIRGYLQMPDSWAVARSHPVELLETKLNEIQRFLETGKVVTKKVVQHAEELVDKAQGTNRKPRRKLEEIEAERDQQRLLASGGEK